ncbi:benzoate-CoA ligase family protein [Longimicrobium sp.]|uniref:benzoate-CoA ligase family protein n=1 Tax=Longimicrobium sp. TaxID=2029185 RepID=UPI002BF36038|nr:benzoate-CoA ligase family protein [Longimicrobium sp.]HSU14051.1 benzoate-CoA ligase family protein [Longimicrobium sp.]
MLAAEPAPQAAPTAHLDTFARDNLPPPEQWPAMDLSGVPHLAARPRINAAAEFLDAMCAAGHADRPALLAPGVRWTYAELTERANRIAGVLREMGIVPGNRVLLRGYNSPMTFAAWFGVLKAGGIVVATMPLLRAREISAIIAKAQVRFALCDARLMAEMDEAASSSPCLERTVAFGTDAEDALERRMARQSAGFANVPTSAEDVAMIAFTSGTTGQPKGTMHFHRDLLASADTFSAHVLRPEPDDVFCGSPPLAFTFGLGGYVLFPMRVGAATVMLEQASPPNLLQGIQDFRATVCFTAPTAYRAMAGMARDFDLSSLRKCVSAGEPLPAATFEAWREATGVKIIDGIGSTEMLHIFISSAGEDIRPGSTGRAVPGYRARVVDDAGREVPPGEPGRLMVRGPTGCRYLADPERQRAYVQDGWNVTGDTYVMDADGYFWYQARNDDMIISAGYNIAGPEVENCLLEHPAVLECAVVAAPDPERGNVVKAFVVLREGFTGDDGMVKTLQDFAKQSIAPYKYPRRVEFVSALPRTQTGKLQRFRLRQQEGTAAG